MNHLHPTMRTDDKVRIANTVYKPLFQKAEVYLNWQLKKIVKRARFPFYFCREIEYEDYGKWIVFLCIPEKPSYKRGYHIMCSCFQPYIIDYAKNPDNNGLGLYMIQGGETFEDIRIDEFAPHLINRMIQRADESLVDLTVAKLCLQIFKTVRTTLFSVKEVTHDVRGEEMNEFVQSIPGGQILGLINEDSSYRCLKTFISEHEMKDSQFAHNEILRQISLIKDDRPKTFDLDVPVILEQLEKIYGTATFNDAITLLKGTDKSVRQSENIKRLAAGT